MEPRRSSIRSTTRDLFYKIFKPSPILKEEPPQTPSQSSAGWTFQTLRGDMNAVGLAGENPFSYNEKIAASYYEAATKGNFSDTYQRIAAETKKNPAYPDFKLDFTATHHTGVGVTQLAGLRYLDQQDRFAVETIQNFTNLSSAEKANALKNTFAAIQNTLTENQPHELQESGTTANSCVVYSDKENEITVTGTYLGDTMAYLAIIEPDGQVKVEALHEPHDPSNLAERDRVMKDAAEEKKDRLEKTLAVNRVGNLAITAAIGDNDSTGYGIKHVPQVPTDIYNRTVTITPGSRVLIINACDGLTECPTNPKDTTEKHAKEIADIQTVISANQGKSATEISQALAQNAFTAKSTDNITVAVCDAKPGQQATCISVFDGHGSHKVAEAAVKIVNPILQQEVNNQPANRIFYKNILTALENVLFDGKMHKTWENEMGLGRIIGGTVIEKNRGGGIIESIKLPHEIAQMYSYLRTEKFKADEGASERERVMHMQNLVHPIAEKISEKTHGDPEKERKLSSHEKFCLLVDRALKNKDPLIAERTLNESLQEHHIGSSTTRPASSVPAETRPKATTKPPSPSTSRLGR